MQLAVVHGEIGDVQRLCVYKARAIQGAGEKLSESGRGNRGGRERIFLGVFPGPRVVIVMGENSLKIGDRDRGGGTQAPPETFAVTLWLPGWVEAPGE